MERIIKSFHYSHFEYSNQHAIQRRRDSTIVSHTVYFYAMSDSPHMKIIITQTILQLIIVEYLTMIISHRIEIRLRRRITMTFV